MNSNLIEREIQKKRKRAAKLGLDRLVTRIYFEHGFRNYAFIAPEKMNGIFPAVKDVHETERNQLDFRIGSRQYSIRARERTYNRREGMEIEVFRGGDVVFGIILDRRRLGLYSARRITAFAENNWIQDFELLDREARQFRHKATHQEDVTAIVERARRFGIEAAAIEPQGLLARLLAFVRSRLAS